MKKFGINKHAIVCSKYLVLWPKIHKSDVFLVSYEQNIEMFRCVAHNLADVSGLGKFLWFSRITVEEGCC